MYPEIAKKLDKTKGPGTIVTVTKKEMLTADLWAVIATLVNLLTHKEMLQLSTERTSDEINEMTRDQFIAALAEHAMMENNLEPKSLEMVRNQLELSRSTRQLQYRQEALKFVNDIRKAINANTENGVLHILKSIQNSEVEHSDWLKAESRTTFKQYWENVQAQMSAINTYKTVVSMDFQRACNDVKKDKGLQNETRNLIKWFTRDVNAISQNRFFYSRNRPRGKVQDLILIKSKFLEVFPDGKRKNAISNFYRHLEEWKKWSDLAFNATGASKI